MYSCAVVLFMNKFPPVQYYIYCLLNLECEKIISEENNFQYNMKKNIVNVCQNVMFEYSNT